VAIRERRFIDRHAEGCGGFPEVTNLDGLRCLTEAPMPRQAARVCVGIRGQVRHRPQVGTQNHPRRAVGERLAAA